MNERLVEMLTWLKKEAQQGRPVRDPKIIEAIKVRLIDRHPEDDERDYQRCVCTNADVQFH
jgi:hypothetical protein